MAQAMNLGALTCRNIETTPSLFQVAIDRSDKTLESGHIVLLGDAAYLYPAL